MLDADPYGTLQFTPKRQKALFQFIRSSAGRQYWTVSSTLFNVFCPQTHAWYAAKSETMAFHPRHFIEVFNRLGISKSEVFLDLLWGHSFRRKGGQIVYDFYSDLGAHQPLLITMDSFMVRRLTLDAAAAAFLNDQYVVLYHFPSQSFIAVHKLLGRKLIDSWRRTRWLEDRSDQLVARAIENKDDRLELVQNAVALSTDHIEANYLLAQSLFKLDRPLEAEPYVNRVLTLTSDRDTNATRLLLSHIDVPRERRRPLERILKDTLNNMPNAGRMRYLRPGTY
jgi:hypothetical protein